MKKLVCGIVVAGMLGIIAPSFVNGLDTNQDKKTVNTNTKKKEINNEVTKPEINNNMNNSIPEKIQYNNQTREDAIKNREADNYIKSNVGR